MTDQDLPRRISSLPKDDRGFPVPWFVAWSDGNPDFRCVAPGKIDEAMRQSLCWVCGTALGRYKTFVTGPLCAVNGTAAEPPAHHDCGMFSATACPFLSKPRMRRNEKDLAIDTPHPAGPMVDRNPGVVLLWTTRSFKPVTVNDGVLFRVGPPETIEWYAQGRLARRDEVLASLDDGVAHLRKMAEEEGPAAIASLDRLWNAALHLVPTDTVGT